MPLIERTEDARTAAQIEIGEVPPLPRVWFEHRQGDAVIQVQRDRFLHNWRKHGPGSEYPRYATVIGLFQKRFADFERFVSENDLGQVEVRQCELTYVNHIARGEGWETLDDVRRVFPDFSWRPGDERFLPQPEDLNWRAAFPLPDQAGRLHVVIRSARQKADGRSVLILELTARGLSAGSPGGEQWGWFNAAHEWIVRGFSDLTGKEVQETVWRRIR